MKKGQKIVETLCVTVIQFDIVSSKTRSRLQIHGFSSVVVKCSTIPIVAVSRAGLSSTTRDSREHRLVHAIGAASRIVVIIVKISLFAVLAPSTPLSAEISRNAGCICNIETGVLIALWG